ELYCAVNVQHNCETTCCNSFCDVHMYQEHLVSTQTKKVIEHSPIGMYLLNTHALHNYHQILSVLSPD
ncbi:hypothetical protein HD554DRAFT_1985765, partial [Boletus coccyginus]